MGIDTDEMMPPMMTGTLPICTSCVAASTATLPWLCESRVSATSLQPYSNFGCSDLPCSIFTSAFGGSVFGASDLPLSLFAPSDLPAYARLRAHPLLQRFCPEEDAGYGKAEELLRLFLAWSREMPRLGYQLAIVLPSRGVIGSVGVRVTRESERQGSFGCELDAH